MRCSSDQIRLTSEERRLSTHFAFLRSEVRRVLDCGCFSEVPGSIDFSYSWLVDFTGIVRIGPIDLFVELLDSLSLVTGGRFPASVVKMVVVIPAARRV